MKYLRKVNCASLGIQAVLEDQSQALSLYTKLKNLDYNDSELLDYFVEADTEIETDEPNFLFLMSKVITK